MVTVAINDPGDLGQMIFRAITAAVKPISSSILTCRDWPKLNTARRLAGEVAFNSVIIISPLTESVSTSHGGRLRMRWLTGNELWQGDVQYSIAECSFHLIGINLNRQVE